MKVADLFSLNEDFKNCKLIAGEKGIDKEIKKVEIMEVPDGAFWAKEGSVIVTMGYSLKKKNITASSLVQMLIDKNVSALCIKLGRYIDEIPQNVLDYADEHNFAIINVPLNMTYDNIMGPINEKLMDAERYELFLIKKLRTDLCNIIHRNYNMNSIINLIENYVEKNVAVVYADKYDVTGNINENEKEALVDSLKSNIKCVYENEKDILIDSNDKCYRVFKIETEFEINVTKGREKSDYICYAEDSKIKLLNIIALMPFGVISRNFAMEGSVESSVNIGVLEEDEREVRILSSIRSSLASIKHDTVDKFDTLAKIMDCKSESFNDYPQWDYEEKSALREIATKTYEDLFEKQAQVVSVHGGLECGYFSEKIKGIDLISMGCNLYDVHTPREQVSIESIYNNWDLLVEILKRLAKES